MPDVRPIDAGIVTDSLKRVGFAVTVKTNLDLDGFEQAVRLRGGE
jgi:hypothetical protein